MNEKFINITRDYEKFKFLKGNRATTPARIKKIQKSIMHVGYITSPILVNENMEIIDGQGRFEALKGLKMPIEYIVHPGISLKECQAMNVYQTNWKLTDYISSFAEVGNPNYLRLQKLLDDFPFKNVALIASACRGTARFSTTIIMNGDLELSEEEYAYGREGLEAIVDLYQEYKNVPRIMQLLQGALICRTLPNVNLNRLLEKLNEKLISGYIPSFSAMPNVIQFFEEIYNVKLKEPIYIYTEYRKRVKQMARKQAFSLIEKNTSLSRIIRGFEE